LKGRAKANVRGGNVGDVLGGDPLAANEGGKGNTKIRRKKTIQLNTNKFGTIISTHGKEEKKGREWFGKVESPG